jgi:hypothetical protein
MQYLLSKHYKLFCKLLSTNKETNFSNIVIAGQTLSLCITTEGLEARYNSVRGSRQDIYVSMKQSTVVQPPYRFFFFVENLYHSGSIAGRGLKEMFFRDAAPDNRQLHSGEGAARKTLGRFKDNKIVGRDLQPALVAEDAIQPPPATDNQDLLQRFIDINSCQLAVKLQSDDPAPFLTLSR